MKVLAVIFLVLFLPMKCCATEVKYSRQIKKLDVFDKERILKLSVRSTDFLFKNSPLVCAVEPYRSSDRRRNRAFY